MSVIGVSPGSPEAAAPRSIQPVSVYNSATGVPAVPPSAAADGSQPVSGVNGTSIATAANPFPVQAAGMAAHDAAVAGNPVLQGGFASSTAPAAVGAGDAVRAWRGLVGHAIVGSGSSNAADASSNTISVLLDLSGSGRNLGVAGFTYNGASWDRTRKPNATSRIPSSANSTNATSAKASAGDLTNVMGYNSSVTVTYLKVYNKATAPTVGTDAPVLTLPLPPTSAFAFDLGSLYFSTGIAYGLTTDAADAGATAVAAGAILGLCVVYA